MVINVTIMNHHDTSVGKLSNSSEFRFLGSL